MLDQITPVVLTYNEAPNIGRTLGMLAWARDIVVVDSCSTDETVAIAKQHPAVRVVQRPFDTHAQQWNHAVKETGIATEWVLALDADYVLSRELIDELARLAPPHDIAAYRTHFHYCIHGKALRGTAYTPVTTLYRRERATYDQDGHTQRVRVDGATGELRGPIYHDDRKSLAHWCAAQSRYMELEAEKLCARDWRELDSIDRLRRALVVAPLLMPFYCAFVKGNILDGKAGLYYVMQRTVAELLLSLHLLQRRLAR